MKAKQVSRPLLLFDLDGTLTPSRRPMIPEMKGCLIKMKEKFDLAIVGGSDRVKQLEQLGEDNISLFRYIFSENGTYTFQGKDEFHKNSISDFMGKEKLKEFEEFTMNVLDNTNGMNFIKSYI